MQKDELLKIINNNLDSEEPIHIEPGDTEKLQISDIPKDIRMEISTLGKDNIHYVDLEGTIGWQDDKFCIFMSPRLCHFSGYSGCVAYLIQQGI